MKKLFDVVIIKLLHIHKKNKDMFKFRPAKKECIMAR